MHTTYLSIFRTLPGGVLDSQVSLIVTVRGRDDVSGLDATALLLDYAQISCGEHPSSVLRTLRTTRERIRVDTILRRIIAAFELAERSVQSIQEIVERST